nr:MAG TPA: hypothetical protein [Caudoviricetes sp.]
MIRTGQRRKHRGRSRSPLRYESRTLGVDSTLPRPSTVDTPCQ